jgi:hypothetical protein
MGIQVTRSGTNWTVDVTALGLVNDPGEKDFLVVISGLEQPLAAYTKTTATVITYSGAALPTNTIVNLYRWGLRDIDTLQYGEVTSQLGMNRRLEQIERVLDDLREVKQFIWNVGTTGDAAVASHVALPDPHIQYRLKSAAVPVADLSGTLSDAQIPALIARDAEVTAAVAAHEALANPHPGYATAAQLTTALTGYLPTTQKGAINGIAPLDGSSKIPAINSRGCSAVYTASTGVWLFTWADGGTQSIDTPLELVFQSVNYNTTTKQVTFTLVGGATTSFSLADLVDLPEIQIATTVPSSTPTSGQRLYVRSDTGDYWVSNGTVWAGPYLSLTTAERAQLTGLSAALNGKQNADATLQSIANATIAGLIRRNTDESVTLLPTGGMGEQLIATGDAAAIRELINAETWRYPGSTLVATLTGGGLEQRLSDRSVWNNGKIVQGAYLSARELNDRQTGYIRNGGCNFPATPDAGGVLRAENWPGVIAYPIQAVSGNYSLLCNTSYTYLPTECAEYSYVPAGVTLRFAVTVRAKTFVAGNQHFPFIAQYDADKLPNDVYYNSVALSTASTLSAPLAVGATTVRINKGTATQWGNGTYKHLLVFPYKNSFGKIYPKPSDPDNAYCYSRNNAFLGATASVVTTATEYILTLPAPWAYPNPAAGSGGVWPAGTEVAESQGGDGNALYPYGVFLNYEANQDQIFNTANVCLKQTATPGALLLAAGTQFVRIGIACNYGPAGNETLYQMDLIPLP